MFLLHLLLKLSIVGSLCDREVACSASDLQGLNFEFCVWRAVSSHSSHHAQEVLLAQFSLYVHKSGLKPDSSHFISLNTSVVISLNCMGWRQLVKPSLSRNMLSILIWGTMKKCYPPYSASGLQLCFMNAQSAVNKTLDISDFICDKNIDIMVVAETWFKSDSRQL